MIKDDEKDSQISQRVQVISNAPKRYNQKMLVKQDERGTRTVPIEQPQVKHQSYSLSQQVQVAIIKPTTPQDLALRTVIIVLLSIVTISLMCYCFQTIALCSRKCKITLNENKKHNQHSIGSIKQSEISSVHSSESGSSSDFFQHNIDRLPINIPKNKEQK